MADGNTTDGIIGTRRSQRVRGRNLQTERKNYTLNTKTTIQKKIEACNLTQKITYHEKTGNHIFQMQPNTYSIYTNHICQHYTQRSEDSTYPHMVTITDRDDQTGSEVETKIQINNKTSTNRKGCLRFSIMMYHTTSKIMVNGKHGHLFFNDNEHIINNIRADPEYRGANAAIRQQLEAELQAIHDLNRTTYEPQQTVLSNNEPTVNHTSDVEPGPSASNSTLPTQEQPTTTNIDTGAIAHNTLRISNRGAKSNSNDNATADSHNPEEDGTEHRTDNTDDGHSREEDQSNSTPATYTVWLCPICGKQAETNVIECSKCLNWLHYKCEKMTVSTYRTHAISNDLEYNCKSCKCMKEMNELTELYQRGDEVEESSIDTTTNNIPTTEETQRM